MAVRLGKHLDGWQAGLLAVLVAWVVALLVVPRHIEPTEVPPPRVEPRRIDELRRDSSAIEARLTRPNVSPAVRTLGGRLREYGRVEYEGNGKRLEAARESIAMVAGAALHESAEDVVALEAKYAGAFARGCLLWIDRGDVSDDLIELGGDASRTFADRRWKPEPGQAPDDLDVVLRALFRKRFVALVGNHPALAAPPTESLVLLRFLMSKDDDSPKGLVAQFDHIADVEGLDPSYPAKYARGIVLFKLGRYEASAASFDAYLSGGAGAYRGRAGNYLRAAVEEASQ